MLDAKSGPGSKRMHQIRKRSQKGLSDVTSPDDEWVTIHSLQIVLGVSGHRESEVCVWILARSDTVERGTVAEKQMSPVRREVARCARAFMLIASHQHLYFSYFLSLLSFFSEPVFWITCWRGSVWTVEWRNSYSLARLFLQVFILRLIDQCLLQW